MNSNLNNKKAKGWRKRRIADKVEELNIMTVSTVTVDEYNGITKRNVSAGDISNERVAETAKQRHDWIGLTEDEVELEADEATDYYTFKRAVRWAEQRLKERNT
jgi:hypothetical protein